MSGECAEYPRFRFLGLTATGKNEDLAKAASSTLERLNFLIKNISSVRYDRLELESKITRLQWALVKVGKNPDEALRADPLVVHQRDEINRLELTRTRLEDEVRILRIELREADQAITCSGAKRLREKMRKMRADCADTVSKLNDEIGGLKLRLREAEDDSSCSALNRLRGKLREILNVDKKMERIIADVASRSCGTLIDLTNELTRIKEMLDESRMENIKLRDDESRRVKAALESAPNCRLTAGCSGYLETIQRLSFHARELERKIKEFEDDSGLVKRLEETEEALNVCRKHLEDKENSVTSLRHELIGAKTAYKLKSIELTEFKDSKRDLELLKIEFDEREKRVTQLEREIEILKSDAKDAERLRDELKRTKTELLSSQIERDGLLDEIEKTRGIVSDRNEHIVKILEDNEQRDRARRSEIESVKTKLRIAEFEKETVKSRCENFENQSAALLLKLSEVSKASGDSDPLLKKIRQLEGELKLLQEAAKIREQDNSEMKNFQHKIDELEEDKSRLENQLLDMNSKNLDLRSELEEVRSVGKSLIEEKENFRKENSLLKSEIGKMAAGFVGELNELKSKNDEAKRRREDKNIQIDDDSKSMLQTLRADYEDVKMELEELNDLKRANEELKEKLTESESLSKDLKKSLKDLNDLKGENEALSRRLSEVEKARSDLVSEMEKLRLEFEERSGTKAVPVGQNEASEKLIRVSKSGKTLIMDCGDYIRADRELKYYIHLQSLAVKRVVDFISYVDGKTGSKPAMATFVEPTKTNLTLLNFDENLTTTFRMSQKLSQKIFQAETEVQKLEAVRNERNNLKAERDCLNNGMEKLTRMLSNLAQDIYKIPQSVQLLNDHSQAHFEFESLNKIAVSGAPSSALITKENLDGARFVGQKKSRQNADEKFWEMNQRISSLRNQIEFKQREAARKLIEMRETMRQERIRLMEIADRENVTVTTPYSQLR